MQLFSEDGTRQERTGWRDEEISKRHREWGFNCPAVDLDFLVVEYNFGKPVALIEYKHNKAAPPILKHATYSALSALADGYTDGPLPFVVAFYWPGVWAFRITPVNKAAFDAFQDGEMLSEYEFVRRLYKLRRLTITSELEGKLNKDLPHGGYA
jgi:hypothetical protein